MPDQGADRRRRSIVAEAHNEADAIRREAAEAGCQAAVAEIERMVAEKTAPAIAALRQAAAELQAAKQAWLSHWEAAAVELAAAIAEKIIRRELHGRPQITLALVPRHWNWPPAAPMSTCN